MHKIEIQFQPNSLKNHDKIIKKYIRQQLLMEIRHNKTISYAATFWSSEINSYIELLKNVRSLRILYVYIDDKLTTFKNTFSFLDCYEERGESKNKKEYCASESGTIYLWGCRNCKLGYPNTPSEAYGIHLEMITSGSWGNDCDENQRTWYFDKTLIKSLLINHLTAYHLCPNFNDELASKLLELLPDKVVFNRIKRSLINPEWKIALGGILPKDKLTILKLIKQAKKIIRHRLTN